MKNYLVLFIAFYFSAAVAQDAKPDAVKSVNASIKDILKYPHRDFKDNRCQQLFSDYYECLESDKGRENPKMAQVLRDLEKYKADKDMPNAELAVLLAGYLDAAADPKIAGLWVRALKDEYYAVYQKPHTLPLIFEGEVLVKDGRKADANAYFNKLHNTYPESVIAQCYICQTEPDKEQYRAWLKKLRNDHPNHWMVKKFD